MQHIWKTLHLIAYQFPRSPTDTDRRHYREFYENIGHVLPCDECREHWKKQLQEHPVDVSSRRALTRWLYERHNQVNTQLRNEYDGLSDTRKKTYVKTWAIQHRRDPTLAEIDAMYKK